MYKLDTVSFFYSLPVTTQCKLWNAFAQTIKDKDGDYIFMFPNETLDDFYESLKLFPKYYDLDGLDMYMLGVFSHNEQDSRFMYLDTENHEIVTCNNIDDGVNDETLEAFFDWFHELCNAKKGE